MVLMPMDSILTLIFFPTPNNRSTGNGDKKHPTSSGVMMVKPSGFWLSHAILATSLFGPTPIVKEMPDLLFYVVFISSA